MYCITSPAGRGGGGFGCSGTVVEIDFGYDQLGFSLDNAGCSANMQT